MTHDGESRLYWSGKLKKRFIRGMSAVLILLVASYIRFSHVPMLGFVGLGASCMIGGIYINHIRRKARVPKDLSAPIDSVK